MAASSPEVEADTMSEDGATSVSGASTMGTEELPLFSKHKTTLQEVSIEVMQACAKAANVCAAVRACAAAMTACERAAELVRAKELKQVEQQENSSCAASPSPQPVAKRQKSFNASRKNEGVGRSGANSRPRVVVRDVEIFVPAPLDVEGGMVAVGGGLGIAAAPLPKASSPKARSPKGDKPSVKAKDGAATSAKGDKAAAGVSKSSSPRASPAKQKANKRGGFTANALEAEAEAKTDVPIGLGAGMLGEDGDESLSTLMSLNMEGYLEGFGRRAACMRACWGPQHTSGYHQPPLPKMEVSLSSSHDARSPALLPLPPFLFDVSSSSLTMAPLLAPCSCDVDSFFQVDSADGAPAPSPAAALITPSHAAASNLFGEFCAEITGEIAPLGRTYSVETA